MKKILLAIMTVGVLSVNGQTLLNEDFNYPTNDTIASVNPSKGWLISSGSTTNYIKATAPGLVFSGYPGSGIGNSTTLTTTGQDIYKDASASVTTGSIYASFMFNVTAAQSAGDYFMAILPNTSTTAFFARLFIKSNSSGHFFVGITKAAAGANEAVTYSSDSFAFNTTLLGVLKYEYNTGTNNDSVKVYIISNSVPSQEPTYATAQNLGAINAGNSDATSLGRILLRQGTASNAPSVIVDGIRMATTWNNSALPVQFKSFTASKGDKAINLKWATASESNNKGFEVQRSVNGAKYQTVGFVKGNGNSSVVKTYSFADVTSTTGNICYRLKQIDFDGASEYSKVACVNVEVEKTTGVITTPNPFNGSLHIKYNSLTEGTANLQIIDMLGKTHQNINMDVNKGETTLTLDTDALPLGIYFIRMTNGTEVTTQRIVKK